MTKRWKRVAGASTYSISSDGEIRNFAKELLSPMDNASGYKCVFLRMNDGTRRNVLVHRMVLETFIGACTKGMHGCHNNGIKTDNRLINLRWDSRSGNMKDKHIHGTIRRNRQLHSREKIASIIRMKESGMSLREVSKESGVHLSTVARHWWQHTGRLN